MSGYVPSRGCASCPYSTTTCHESRQHAMDGLLEVGRHYDCEFYVSIRARADAAPRRLLAGAVRWIRDRFAWR